MKKFPVGEYLKAHFQKLCAVLQNLKKWRCAMGIDRKRLRPTSRQVFREPASRVVRTVFKKPASVSRFPERVVRKSVSVIRTVPRKVRPDTTVTRVREEKTKTTERVETKLSRPKPAEDKPRSTSESDNQDITKAEEIHDGPSDLDDVTKKVLDLEMQTILKKVLDVFPDNTESETDFVVANRFRQYAGYRFVKVLANNVAQRLLDIHLPLLVNISFKSRPNAEAFKAFLKQFNCTAIKRTHTREFTFAVRMKNAADFDRICALKTAECGNTRLTIKPFYKFLKSPTKLQYVYQKPKITGKSDKHTDKESEGSKKQDTQTKANTDSKAKQKVEQESSDKVSEIKDLIKKDDNSEENKKPVPTGNDSKVKENTTTVKEKQINSKVENTKKTSAAQETKPETKATTAESVNKSSATSNIQKTEVPTNTNKTEAARKPNDSKTPVKANTTPIKVNPTPAKTNPNTTENESKTTVPEKPKANETTTNIVVKSEPTVEKPKVTAVAKEAEIQQQTTTSKKTEAPQLVKNATHSANTATNASKVENQKSDKNTNTKPKTPVKATTQAKAKTPVKATLQAKPVTPQISAKTVTLKTNDKKSLTPVKTDEAKVQTSKVKDNNISKLSDGNEKEQSDNDELDDYDILAMMSEAIILDECGSDDE